MAQDAFALSPISARATQPSEEDYDAISEAFMETARGRWFLGEYAKRNRNADTRMVLDAVERIEQNLAAQKQPVIDNRLPEALAAIKAALDQARAAASTALDDLSLDQHLAPVRKGVRVIREISWRWREIGADGRICDLIDQQIAAIEASCGQIASVDPRAALRAAFDLIEDRIVELDEDGKRPAKADRSAGSPPASAVPDETPDTATERTPPATAVDDTQAVANAELSSYEASPEDLAPEEAVAAEPAIAATDVDASEAIAEVEDAPLQTAEPVEEIADMTAEAADAHDDAVLDMVAFEMAAVDPFDEEIEADAAEMHDADGLAAEPDAVAEMPAIAMATPEIAIPEIAITAPEITMPEVEAPEVTATVATDTRPSLASMLSLQAVPEAASQPAPQNPVAQPAEPSLGSTLVASGFLRKPVSTNDPLAAIRRLSQAEKIALFS